MKPIKTIETGTDAMEINYLPDEQRFVLRLPAVGNQLVEDGSLQVSLPEYLIPLMMMELESE